SIAKIDKFKKTGAQGGPEAKLLTIHNAVLDIIGRDSAMQSIPLKKRNLQYFKPPTPLENTDALKNEKLKLEVDFLRVQVVTHKSKQEVYEMKKPKLQLEITALEGSRLISTASSPPVFARQSYNDPYLQEANTNSFTLFNNHTMGN
uniref:Uncharacterized protein n=1 Tax=Romanomermis culicivorax TaxID=13658 RepID=A0A915I1V0_ROMCU